MELRRNKGHYEIPNRGVTTVNDNYPSTFNAQSFLEQSKVPEYVYTENFVVINSADRDTARYQLHYNYVVDLIGTYKNVISVNLISAVLPNTSGILTEPYLVLSLGGDIDHIDFGTLSNNHKGFTTLPIKSPGTNSFIVPDLSGACNSEVLFRTPLARLPRLTIKLKDYTGALYNFGAPGGSTAKADQHSFTLRIVTRELSRASLGNRNVS